MKVVSIIGARPQFIKAAVVSLALRNIGLKEVVIHTGQHFDDNMNDVFFRELNIDPPAYNLGISGGSHGEQTGNMIIEIEKVLQKEEPKMIILYGDTNSTLAGTIASSKLHIPIAHVEAGLRSFNMKMPEEINRILTDRVSSLLFTPTQIADFNLQKEGVDKKKIINVGDVMYDAALVFGESSSKKDVLVKSLKLDKQWVLATIHRAENTDNPERLNAIFNSLEKLSLSNKVVLPLHPRTRKALQSVDFDIESSKIVFIDPIGYLDMLNFEKEASLIITDSGGVQKEAYFNSTRCLVVRDETEWVELVEIDFNRLVKNYHEIASEALEMLSENHEVEKKDIYGQGDAAQKIAEEVSSFLNG